MTEDVILARIDKARIILREANTLLKVKRVMAIAKAAEVYAKEIKATIGTQNYAAEIRLRAARRLGEILSVAPKAKPPSGKGQKRTDRRYTQSTDGSETLASIGISKNESSRSQVLASVPEKEFEAALVVEPGKELNHNRVCIQFKETRQRQVRKSKRTEAAGGLRLDERIIVGDFREQAGVVPVNSLALIFTDPPYDRKAEELFPALADFAAAKLAEGGSIIFYVGHLQLPAAFRAFDGKLRHWWTCACMHSGDKALMREYGIRVGWKPMLWFVKGTRDDKTEIVFDTVTGDKEKTHHDWQQHQSDAEYYIEHLCPKDGIICDPFLGGGTTAAAAQKLKRQWIAFEIDPDTARIASSRL
jgi:hypothetical protein